MYYYQNNNHHDNVYCDNNISVVFSFERMRRQARFSWRNRKKNIIILIYGRQGPRTIRLHFISIYIMVEKKNQKKPWARRIVFPVFRFYILLFLFFLSLLLCVIIIIRVALSLGHLFLLCCCSAEFLFHPLSVMSSDFLFYLYIMLPAICTSNIIYFSGENA